MWKQSRRREPCSWEALKSLSTALKRNIFSSGRSAGGGPSLGFFRPIPSRSGGALAARRVLLRRFPAAVALVVGAMVRWSEGKPSLGRGGGAVERGET
jgi:hypothetical protein